MPWQQYLGNASVYSVEAQERTSKSVLQSYRKAIHARNRTPLIWETPFSHIQVFPKEGVVTWQHHYHFKTLIVATNMSRQWSPSVRVQLAGSKKKYKIPSLPPFTLAKFTVS